MDEMFAMLDRTGVRLVPVFVWNLVQFPTLAHETVSAMVRNPRSRSRQLLEKYIADFIGRYRTRGTILFYELTNEMNLAADVDLHKFCTRGQASGDREACAATDNFTSDQMSSFAGDLSTYIRRLDPSKQISSGYSLPRPSAEHMAEHPQFSAGGGDWDKDSITQWTEYLTRIHNPFDIISVHVYPDRPGDQSNKAEDLTIQMLSSAASTARTLAKPLFVGEFGDDGESIPKSGISPFISQIVKYLGSSDIQYAAFWS